MNERVKAQAVLTAFGKPPVPRSRKERTQKDVLAIVRGFNIMCSVKKGGTFRVAPRYSETARMLSMVEVEAAAFYTKDHVAAIDRAFELHLIEDPYCNCGDCIERYTHKEENA